MRGKGDKVIITITAYRVCQTSLAGPNTAHSQQWQMLTKQGKTEPNPRQQFLTDLECFINTRRAPPNHEQIILSLDANEPLTDPNNPEKITGISKLLRNCGMRDMYEYKHGPLCGDTSNKKVHKIDHVAATESILPAVKECGFF